VSATRRPARRTTTRRRTTNRRTTYRTTRRRTPKLATTLGAALGALLISVVTDMSWPLRIGLVVLAVLVAVGYLLWSHRAEIATGAQERSPDGTNPSEPPAPSTAPEQP
jgi:hypothetical protein